MMNYEQDATKRIVGGSMRAQIFPRRSILLSNHGNAYSGSRKLNLHGYRWLHPANKKPVSDNIYALEIDRDKYYTEFDTVNFEIFLIFAMIFHILISGILICGQFSSKIKGNVAAAISVMWIISAAIDVMFFTLTSAFIYVMIWPIAINIFELVFIGIVACSIKSTDEKTENDGQGVQAPQQMQQGQQMQQQNSQQFGPQQPSQQNSQQFGPQQPSQQNLQQFGPPPPYTTVAPQPFIQNSGNGKIPPQPGQTFPAVPEGSSV